MSTCSGHQLGGPAAPPVPRRCRAHTRRRRPLDRTAWAETAGCRTAPRTQPRNRSKGTWSRDPTWRTSSTVSFSPACRCADHGHAAPRRRAGAGHRLQPAHMGQNGAIPGPLRTGST